MSQGPLTVAASLLIVVAAAASTQDDPLLAGYVALVDGFRAGQADAPGAAARLSRQELDRVVPLAAARGGRFAQAAALLHLQAAITLAAHDWARGTPHLDAAGALAQALPTAEEVFAERVFAVVPTLLLAHGDIDGARRWFERGLQLFEFSAPIHTAAGMIEEQVAHGADPECAGLGCPSGAARALVPERLREAERHYTTALQRDPTLVEPRLRRGRVLALLERDEEAVAELGAAIATGSTRQRYLAYLFRGAIHTRRHMPDAARGDYEAAAALAPGRQTPLLAMSHLEETLGHVGRARELLAPLAALPNGIGDDPWWSYQNGGIDEETLAWLRDYVRQ